MVWLTGASSGIGAALAKELLRRGATLAISARRLDLLEKIADEAPSNRCKAFPCDVTNLENTMAAAHSIRTHFNTPIDIIIANAGTYTPTDPKNFDSSSYASLMSTNYLGTLHAIQAVLPEMIKNTSGTIAVVASLVGYRGLPHAAAYGASKAAIINFFESIRFHLKSHNIKVSIINPGFVKTPLTDKNNFYMPFIVSPEMAAIKICNGLEADQHEITFPLPLNWIVWCGKFLPSRLYQFLVDFMW